MENQIYAIRTTANREEQVLDFVEANLSKKKLEVYSLIHAHGMRGYIFIEATYEEDVKQAIHGVPYARGLLGKPVSYEEIEPMLEQIKTPMNIQEKDIKTEIQSISLNYADNSSVQKLLDTIANIIADEYIEKAKQNPEIFLEIGGKK